MQIIGQDSRGNCLYHTVSSIGSTQYWSDEIGGGVLIWDTALVSEEMLFLAMAIHRTRPKMENADLPECPLHGSHAMNYITGVCNKCLEDQTGGPFGSHKNYTPSIDQLAAAGDYEPPTEKFEDKPGYPLATPRPELPSFGGVPIDHARLAATEVRSLTAGLEPTDIINRLLQDPNPLCSEAAGVISRLRSALRAAQPRSA